MNPARRPIKVREDQYLHFTVGSSVGIDKATARSCQHTKAKMKASKRAYPENQIILIALLVLEAR